MQIDHDSEKMSKIKKERQSLIGFIRSLEGNVLVLKRQISEQEKTIQDKVTGARPLRGSASTV